MKYHLLSGFFLLLCATALTLSSCAARVVARSKLYASVQQQGLVFRLHDYKQRFDYYEKNGLHDRAVQEKAENDAYNRQIMQAFRKHFDFCNIQFYYSSQRKELEARKPVLLNDRLQPDASIRVPAKLLFSGFDYGQVDDHSTPRKSFRVEGTEIKIRHSSFFRWLGRGEVDSTDIKKVNRVMWRRTRIEQKER